MNLLRDLIACHRKFGQTIGTTPAVPDEATVSLRCRLIDEEYRESIDAIGVGDLPEIAKELADLLYVVTGTFVAYGIDPGPVFAAVHASNMSKPGTKDEAGKFLKGEHYEAPDIAGILAQQGPIDGRGPMTPGETAALEELEHRATQTVRADIIGLALREIRDRDLYRGTHASFNEYCHSKWQYSHHIAGLFIACADPDSRYSQMANKIKKHRITPAPLTFKEKRAFILMCLDDSYLSAWSDEKIASRCGSSPSLVADIRSEHAAPAETKVAS